MEHNIMKKIVFVMFFLLLSCVYAQSPIYSDSLLLDIDMTSGFDLDFKQGNSRIDFVKAEFEFFPIDSYNQDIIVLETQPQADIQEDSILFQWNSIPENEYDFTVSSRVRTYHKFHPLYSKVVFPITEVDSDLKEYLEETEKIVIDDDILHQANQIAEGEDDLFIVEFKLATWTKENIEYNLNTLTETASQDSAWVLQNKYGVCDELTNLFIAMNRALGIPARFVSGLSYTDSELFQENWGLHGWAEVYFPRYGWVSFDPTYGQYGYIDASHVKLSQSVDSDKSSTSYEWQGVNVDLTPNMMETDVEIIEQDSKIENPISISVDIHSNKVDFGSYNLVKAKIKNNKNHYVGLELSLNKPIELENIGKEVKYVYLAPKQEKTVYWLVQVDDNLKKNYIYTFKISVDSSLGFSEEEIFTSENRAIHYTYDNMNYLIGQLKEQEEKVYSRSLELDCSVPSTVYANESFSIKCKTTNSGNVFLNNLKVCLEECETFDLGISQSKTIEFTHLIEKSGEQELIVRARNYQVSSFETLRLKAFDKPEISIEKLQYPSTLKYGPDFDINFEIWKHSLTSPKNMTVRFSFNNKDTTWVIDELDSNQGFKVNLEKNLLNPDKNEFKIIINYHDDNNRLYTKYYEKELTLEETNFFTKFLMWLNKWSRDIENIILNRNI